MTEPAPLKPLDLIIVEDSEDDFLLLLAHLGSTGWKVTARRVETADGLSAALAARHPMAVISDHQLPGFGSKQSLAIVRAFDPDLPFILVSGAIGEEVAVAAMQAGADDYVMKDRLARLSPGLTHALEAAAARRQRREAEAALVASRQELRELASHLARVRELEREAIGREIHDDVGSTLMAVKFDVALLKSRFRDQPDAAERLTELDRLVDAAILASTRIMHDLRPGILDEGIVAALEWQGRDFQHRLGIATTFSASAESIPVDRATSIAMFRICQEALNNIAKYAGATRVEIVLDSRDSRLQLLIHDNGRGIAREDLAKRDCFGLRGMRERAVSLGGTVEVTGAPGRGTTVALTLPLESGGAPPHGES